jgi:hypothetical protein
MEAALCNAAADATDVTGFQSVQDGGAIKHNHYAFSGTCIMRGDPPPDLQARSAHSNCNSRRCHRRQYLHADDENVTGVFRSAFAALRPQPATPPHRESARRVGKARSGRHPDCGDPDGYRTDREAPIPAGY